MAGNRISHLGEPEKSNDAVRLSYANEFYLKHVIEQILCDTIYLQVVID